MPEDRGNGQPYTVLLLEDSKADVFLLERELKRMISEVSLLAATTKEEYQHYLQTTSPDLIISDYRIPQYSGIEALMYARAHAPVVPFVFVTGALLNEELAADTILKGASGFVLKNNLPKLGEIIPGLLQKKNAGVEGDDKDDNTNRPSEQTSVSNGSIEGMIEDLGKADPETIAKIKALLAK